MDILTSLNLNRNELQNAVLQNLGSSPSITKEGLLYYNSGTGVKRPYIHNGTDFKGLAYMDETLNKSLFTAAGDMLYASASGTPAILSKGSNGQILKLSNGLPSWQDEQSLYGLTIQKNDTTIGTYTPNVEAKTINITDVASAETLSSLKTWIESMFVKDTTSVSGTTLIKAKFALYSDYEITAGGIGSGGGGGGGLITSCKESTDFSLTASDFDDTLTNETFNAYSINWLYSQLVPFINSKGAANGLASLDTNGKVPLTQLPDTILGQMIYGGTVNASGVATLSTNAKKKLGISSSTISTITLYNGASTSSNPYGYDKCEGLYFIMSANSSFASLDLLVGDWLISTGSAWKKIDNTDAVTSVVGQTGTITTAQIATALTDAGYKLTDTDTKNTAGSIQSTSKLFLIGATSQGDNPQTYSNANVYATNGSLFASKFNELALTKASTGFTIAGGTTSKTLTVNESYTLGAACAKGVATSIASNSTDANLATALSVYNYAAPKLSSTITANTSDLVFAKWNANGLVTGAGSTAYKKTLTFNGTAYANILRTTNADLPSFYAPTTAGSKNDVLVSTAGTPQWKSLIHSYDISGSSVTSFTTSTNFTTQNLVASLYDSSNELVLVDISIKSSTVSGSTVYNVKVDFAEAIGTGTYRLVVIGI